MKCSKCSAENHPSLDRCLQCGADLLATPPEPPRAQLAAKAALSAFFGGFGLLIVLSLEAEHPTPLTRGTGAIPYVYLMFGRWPPVIAVWGIAAAFLVQAWRTSPAKGTKTANGSDANTHLNLVSGHSATTSAAPSRLHQMLGILLFVSSGIFLGLVLVGIAPLLPPGAVRPLIAYVSSGITAVMVGVALVILKPRVPRRGAGQSLEDYWSMPDVSVTVSPVWFLLEAEGTFAGFGYSLTGERVSMITMGLAIVAFWWCGPRAFAKT